MVRAPAAKAGGPGFDSHAVAALFFCFFSSSWLTNVNEMKIRGVLVQLSCYERKDLWCSSTVQLLLA